MKNTIYLMFILLITSCVIKDPIKKDSQLILKNNTIRKIVVNYYSNVYGNHSILINAQKDTTLSGLPTFMFASDSANIYYDTTKILRCVNDASVCNISNNKRNVLCQANYALTQSDLYNIYTYIFTDADYAAADSIK